MDSDQPHIAARRTEPPPELIDLCWRMLGPGNKILSAGVYRVVSPIQLVAGPYGSRALIEVRASYGDDDLLRSEKSIGDGHARCAEWRQSLLAQGTWRELPVEN